jgi:hypothetical protein
MFRVENTSLVSTDGLSKGYRIKPALSFRLGNHIFIRSEFEYSRNSDNFIYVTSKLTDLEWQYILARIQQQTYNFTLRFNYNITPDISIQYYGSPFVSMGRYNDFKRAENPASAREIDRTHSFSGSEITYDMASGTYSITEGSKSYSFNKPDFSFREFRSNFVVRWEYRPGSTLYLVWENHRNSRDNAYYSALSDNYHDLFGVTPTNVFMVKISYWLGL